MPLILSPDAVSPPPYLRNVNVTPPWAHTRLPWRSVVLLLLLVLVTRHGGRVKHSLSDSYRKWLAYPSLYSLSIDMRDDVTGASPVYILSVMIAISTITSSVVTMVTGCKYSLWV